MKKLFRTHSETSSDKAKVLIDYEKLFGLIESNQSQMLEKLLSPVLHEFEEILEEKSQEYSEYRTHLFQQQIKRATLLLEQYNLLTKEQEIVKPFFQKLFDIKEQLTSYQDALTKDDVNVDTIDIQRLFYNLEREHLPVSIKSDLLKRGYDAQINKLHNALYLFEISKECRRVELNLKRIKAESRSYKASPSDAESSLKINLNILNLARLRKGTQLSVTEEQEHQKLQKHKSVLQAKIQLLILELKLKQLAEKLYDNSNNDLAFFQQRHSKEQYLQHKFEHYAILKQSLLDFKEEIETQKVSIMDKYDNSKDRLEDLVAKCENTINNCDLLKKHYQNNRDSLTNVLLSPEEIKKENLIIYDQLLKSLLDCSSYKLLKAHIENIKPGKNKLKIGKQEKFEELNNKLNPLEDNDKAAEELILALKQFIANADTKTAITRNTGLGIVKNPPSKKLFTAFQESAFVLIKEASSKMAENADRGYGNFQPSKRAAM